MASAGYKSGFLVSDDDITYVEVDGIKSFDHSQERVVLDTTSFKTTGNNRTKIMGLRDSTVSFDGDYIAADPGQVILRAAHNSTADNPPLYVKLLHDGTNGLKMPVVIPSLTTNSGVEDLATISGSLEQNGAATEVP